MRHKQNGGWKWNGNLYDINKIQYSPRSIKKEPSARTDYSISMFQLFVTHPTKHGLLKGGSESRAQPRYALWLQICFGPRWHSPKKECLRRQVINLTPPRRVRTWSSRRVSRVTWMLGFQGTHSRQLRPCDCHRQRLYISPTSQECPTYSWGMRHTH